MQEAQPIINHAVTAWLRNLLLADSSPVGLDDSVENQYSLPVEIDSH